MCCNCFPALHNWVSLPETHSCKESLQFVSTSQKEHWQVFCPGVQYLQTQAGWTTVSKAMLMSLAHFTTITVQHALPPQNHNMSPSNTLFSPILFPTFWRPSHILMFRNPISKTSRHEFGSAVIRNFYSYNLRWYPSCFSSWKWVWNFSFKNRRNTFFLYSVKPKNAGFATTMWKTAVVRAYVQRSAKSQTPWNGPHGHTMKLQVYLEWMQGLIALPSFQV